MPREITILSSEDHDLYALAHAAEGIAGAASVREIDDGAAVQVLREDGVSLLTVYAPRQLHTYGEIERLLPDAPDVTLPTWWSDAFAPWGEVGEAGVSIALRLALGLGAVCLVED
ncbi:hypothetical protein GCM10025867_38450 [Frondihabitans sucicola]|uniref:Uncharacterized protein n=1 Tax=Frondihabitans sucicola TaxID=1268041 RepID=A0ABM8GT08_9MICO|nr:hypothetical protein [Frondihabitans sucicola]BDZ51604.1 hypothetical protein GCM10025867_38450 [Frondihabitans sucicola]